MGGAVYVPENRPEGMGNDIIPLYVVCNVQSNSNDVSVVVVI